MPPLCVDLDGTLLGTDVFWESILLLARRSPGTLFMLPLWRLRGKAHAKRRLAERVMPDPARLPYRDDVLAVLETEYQAGREIVLATSADQAVAHRIAEHLGLFSAVLASDGRTDLAGTAKLDALRDWLNGRTFHYMGNDCADLPLWAAAEEAMMVDPSAWTAHRASPHATVLRLRLGFGTRAIQLLRAMRLHQWSKNLLIFLGPLLAHAYMEPGTLLSALVAFLAFGLVASGGYILNDLLDLEHDRAHPRKRGRPFAAAHLAPATGAVAIPILVATGLLVSLALPLAFTGVVFLYLMTSFSYSLTLKKELVLDVFVLAGLYTLRIWAGVLATNVVLSHWLAAFSLFFFVSLAFLKRYAELILVGINQLPQANGRGYIAEDAALLRSVGTASGYGSVLVLALYLNSTDVLQLYRRPELLWFVLPLMLYWLTHVWFAAHRRTMHDDPIVFTARDPVSRVIGVLIAATLIAASV